MLSRNRPITHSGKEAEERRDAGQGHPQTTAHRRPSTTRVPPRSSPAELDLPGVPSLDLRAQPEARSTTTKIEDRPRHVRIAVHVETHGVSVGETEYPGDVVRVDQIIEKYATGHRTSLHLSADREYTCDLSVRRML
jgi:hypothetical protein